MTVYQKFQIAIAFAAVMVAFLGLVLTVVVMLRKYIHEARKNATESATRHAESAVFYRETKDAIGGFYVKLDTHINQENEKFDSIRKEIRDLHACVIKRARAFEANDDPTPLEA